MKTQSKEDAFTEAVLACSVAILFIRNIQYEPLDGLLLALFGDGYNAVCSDVEDTKTLGKI